MIAQVMYLSIWWSYSASIVSGSTFLLVPTSSNKSYISCLR